MRIARLHVLTCALVLLSVAALAVGCGEKSEPSPKQLEAAMGDVIAAQNRFGLDLYRRLAASTLTKQCSSPRSASTSRLRWPTRSRRHHRRRMGAVARRPSRR